MPYIVVLMPDMSAFESKFVMFAASERCVTSSSDWHTLHDWPVARPALPGCFACCDDCNIAVCQGTLASRVIFGMPCAAWLLGCT